MAALLRELVLTADERHAQFVRGQIVAMSDMIDLDQSIEYAVRQRQQSAPLADDGGPEDY